jgi:hypothetical protein
MIMGLIAWVNDESNQKALKFIGSGIVAVVATAWMGYKEFMTTTTPPPAELNVSAQATPSQAVSPDLNASTPAPVVQNVSAENGNNAVAVSGSGNSVTIGH